MCFYYQINEFNPTIVKCQGVKDFLAVVCLMLLELWTCLSNIRLYSHLKRLVCVQYEVYTMAGLLMKA